MKSLRVESLNTIWQDELSEDGKASSYYALSPRVNRLCWQVAYGPGMTTTEIALHGSFDGVTDFHIVTTTNPNGELLETDVKVPFIRFHMHTIDEGIAVTLLAMPKHKHRLSAS